MFLLGHDTSKNNHMHQNSIEAMHFDAGSSYLISMADEDDKPLLWNLLAPTGQQVWNEQPALTHKNPIDLNSIIPGGIDTISFSSIEPKFVATIRMTRTAAVVKIMKS